MAVLVWKQAGFVGMYKTLVPVLGGRWLVQKYFSE